MTLEISDKTFCITGKIGIIDPKTEKFYSRKAFSSLIRKRGGIVEKKVTDDLDYLVIGRLGSPNYSEGVKGRKQIKAEQQPNTIILSDTELFESFQDA